MVQGTMKWTSPTREFGLLTPDDGSRDVFIRFASALASTCTSDGQGGFVVKDVVAPTRALAQGGVERRSPH
jgi:cold shock CspA family protein